MAGIREIGKAKREGDGGRLRFGGASEGIA